MTDIIIVCAGSVAIEVFSVIESINKLEIEKRYECCWASSAAGKISSTL